MDRVNKDVITFAMTKNAKEFTNSINNILHQKATEAMTGKVPEIASALFKSGYSPKSGDEQEFVDQHTITVTDYPVKNEDGVPFTAGNIKHVSPGGIQMGEELIHIFDQGTIEEQKQSQRYVFHVHMPPHIAREMGVKPGTDDISNMADRLEPVGEKPKNVVVKLTVPGTNINDAMNKAAIHTTKYYGTDVQLKYVGKMNEQEALDVVNNYISEKTLTKPEMRKREEIVMAMKRKMKPKSEAEKSRMYAIATAQAKKSA